ncbi:MAG: hypothetical protein Q4F95_13570 [Oscillospiraceae bacterium]|nr:hypothetical protein [Oscillospiraceae bacterium]
MKVIKLFLVCAVIILAVFTLPVTVYAQDNLQDSADTIDDVLDSSSGGYLSENGISVGDPSSITGIQPKSIIDKLVGEVKSRIQAPLKLFITLLTVVFMASLVNSLCMQGVSSGIGNIACIVSILISVSLLAQPVSQSFLDAKNALSSGGLFMLSYIPVMSSLMTVSGNIATAGSYNLIVLTIAELSVQIASGMLMPALSLCLCIGIVDSLNPSLSLSGLLSGMKKAITLVLGMIMTIFVGLLSIQSIVGSSADSLSVKTGKYLVSNLVPVIGGAVSDAYVTVRGSLGVLKSGVGTAGIVILLMTVLPTIINLFLYRAAIWAASVAAEILSADKLKNLLRSIQSVYGIAISIVAAFIVMLIVSTVIVMMIGTGI